VHSVLAVAKAVVLILYLEGALYDRSRDEAPHISSGMLRYGNEAYSLEYAPHS
jgi:hypothetical protein